AIGVGGWFVRGRHQQGPTAGTSPGGVLVTDPVSGQRVDPATTPYKQDLHELIPDAPRGTVFYFASAENLQAFRLNPLAYVRPKVRLKVRVREVEGAPSGPPAEEPAAAEETPAAAEPQTPPAPAPEEEPPAGQEQWTEPTSEPPPLPQEGAAPPGGSEPGWLPPEPGSEPPGGTQGEVIVEPSGAPPSPPPAEDSGEVIVEPASPGR
ncbi:MAG TPA: hypothetical protein VNO81_04090, partial [Candidatus Nitrosotenuis sp.]|nr:hypothetical protein [Candidatus Nitrosotenuis sp.]